MPRPRKAELEGKEVKKRSRNGCWPCKSRKVKCGEEKPACLNCTRQGEVCDYSIRLNWDGRNKRKEDGKAGAGATNITTTTTTTTNTAQKTAPAATSGNGNGHVSTISISSSNGAQSIAGIAGIGSLAPAAAGLSMPPLSTKVDTPPTHPSATPAGAMPNLMAQFQPQPQPQQQQQQQPPPPPPPPPQHPQLEPTLPPISNFPGSFSPSTADFNPAMLASSAFRTPSWNEPSSGRHRDSIAGPMIGPRGSISMPAYPSPSDSVYGGGGGTAFPNGLHDQVSSMPPPLPTSNSVHFQDSVLSPYNSAKRRRISPAYGADSTVANPSLFHRFMADSANASVNALGGSSGSGDTARVHFPPATPTSYPAYVPNPLTPAPSTQTDDDRRISVSSLLSEEPEPISKRSSRSDGRSDTGPTSHPATSNPVTSAAAVSSAVAAAVTAAEAPSRRGSLHQRMISYSETELYGYDRGAPDFDIPHNNDAGAISGQAPSSDQAGEFSSWLEAKFEDPSFGFGTVNRQQVFAAGGYYASPVSIRIPRKLGPLPHTLTENPMNLLYFHHFLNHTAKILVPHDCPENPFKTILPQMAVENANLLNLMLAYSASHRARLLNHPEPANRIAHWVRDVFPSLRQTLDNVSNTNVSNANLATAIMLASLEIISPSSFGVSIPWQQHLSVARSIIRSRGGPNSVSRQDPVMFFLTRWMAYLDVMGSLSGNRNDDPLFAGNYWSSSSADLAARSSATPAATATELSLDDESLEDEDDYTIDCLLGFTTKCVSILAQVALLARECEPHRIDPVTHKIRVNWRPGPDIEARADKLKRDLEHAMNHEQKNCVHHSPPVVKARVAAGHPNSTTTAAAATPATTITSLAPTSSPPSTSLLLPASAYQASHQPHSQPYYYQEYPERRYSAVQMTVQDAHESLSTNTAFHYAGLVHLLRRVHNLPRSDPAIQSAVHAIIAVLGSVRVGGTAEACCLFPTITAGLEAENELDRAEVIRRLKKAEQLGMCQVGRARRLMEESWRRGESWEEMRGVEGAFFG